MRVVLSLVALSVLCACGAKPLTDEQKSKFKELVSQSNSIISTAQSSRSGTTARRAEGTSDAFNTRLSQELGGGNCQMESPQLSATPQNLSTLSLKVTGEQCPLEMDIGIRGSETAAEVRIFFNIKSEELAALSDVTRMELAGTIRQDGDSVSGNLSGYIRSKKYGDVKLGLSMSGGASGLTMELSYSFSDFEVVIALTSSEGGVRYTLNGEEVTEEQLSSMAGGSILPGGNPEAGTTATQTSDSSLSYEFSYNGCSTGKRQFSSPEQMCVGLQSGSLNNHCAEELRRQRFQQMGCPGSFQSQS